MVYTQLIETSLYRRYRIQYWAGRAIVQKFACASFLPCKGCVVATDVTAPVKVPEATLVSTENKARGYYRRFAYVPKQSTTFHLGRLQPAQSRAKTLKTPQSRLFTAQIPSSLLHTDFLQTVPSRTKLINVPKGAFIPGGGGSVLGSPFTPSLSGESIAEESDKPLERRHLALLLPGHNEELIIASTIRSAIAAGQDIEDIYVVDDDSDDETRAIAMKLLGADHVLTVERSGKALAVSKAIDRFDIIDRYEWLHVADADSVFCPDYFTIYKKKLDPAKYSVAVGFVQSLRGNWISNYRSLTYTYSQHVSRRIQSYLGMISVFPGPITSFRTDILPEIDFTADSQTEDFDITLQVHRKKLGKIVYIPRAINYTQDPQNLRDFIKQNLRWQRGFFQGVKKYKIGLHGQRIDASLGFQMSQTVIFMIQLLFLYPLILWATHNWLMIPVAIAIDFILNAAIALWACFVTKRWTLFGALPYFYFLRWVEIGIHLRAFVEVMILGRFKTTVKGWSTKGRRYALSRHALADVAAA